MSGGPQPLPPPILTRDTLTEEDPRWVPALEQTAAPQAVPLLPLRLATPSALCTPTPDLTGVWLLPEQTQKLQPNLPSPIMARPAILP